MVRFRSDQPSLLDFLTDGSLPGILEQLSSLTGVPAWLRDRSGVCIVPGAGASPWALIPEPDAVRRAFANVGRGADAAAAGIGSGGGGGAGGGGGGGGGTLATPIRIGAGLLGEIVTPRPGPGDGAALDRHNTLAVMLRLLAADVAESCESRYALSRRVNELDALYRVSSLLAGANDIDSLLNTALGLAMEVLRVDAGSISIVEDGREDTLTIRSSRGLSPEWVASSSPLSKGGTVRRAVLAGEVVTISDLATDERIADPARAAREGVVSLIASGLIDHGRSIGLIRLYTRTPRRFTRDDSELLLAIAEQVAAAVANERLRLFRTENERIQRQVRLAAQVQQRMLPTRVPSIPPFELAARYSPSFELGGDFYDFMKLGGHLGIVVGDVVGKGVAAALLMAAVRASLRAHAQDVFEIGEVLSRVNKALCEDTLESEFATLWYGVADPRTLRLTYCGAGHDWPILIRRPLGGRALADADLIRLTADGMALGIDETQAYPVGVFHLDAGDILVSYTDGLTDALNFDGKRFGGTRLRKCLVDLLNERPDATANDVVEHVMWTLRQFAGVNTRTDDITLVAVRVDPGAMA